MNTHALNLVVFDFGLVFDSFLSLCFASLRLASPHVPGTEWALLLVGRRHGCRDDAGWEEYGEKHNRSSPSKQQGFLRLS